MWHVLENIKVFLNNNCFSMKQTVYCEKILRCTIRAPPTHSSTRSEKEDKDLCFNKIKGYFDYRV